MTIHIAVKSNAAMLSVTIASISIESSKSRSMVKDPSVHLAKFT